MLVSVDHIVLADGAVYEHCQYVDVIAGTKTDHSSCMQGMPSRWRLFVLHNTTDKYNDTSV
jgi:hypothetical protein